VLDYERLAHDAERSRHEAELAAGCGDVALHHEWSLAAQTQALVSIAGSLAEVNVLLRQIIVRIGDVADSQRPY
jgi:hypothetical protein